MSEFEYGGRRYPLIDPDDWMLAETREVDNWIGASGYAESGLLTRYGCMVAVSIARADPAVKIQAWLNTSTNRTVGEIMLAIQAEDAATEAAQQAEAEVLSPISAGGEHSWPPAEPSSTKSKASGGSRRSSGTGSTPGAGTL